MNLLRGFAPFLDLRYWFNPTPVPLGPSLVGSIVAFFGWFLAVAIVVLAAAAAMRKKDALLSDIIKRCGRMLLATGLLGFVFLFFAYEQLPVLGMRFWALGLLAFFAAWLARIMTRVIRDYPREKDRIVERNRIEKYLSKKK